MGTTHDDKVGKLNSATRKEKDAEKNVARLKNEIRDYTQKRSEIPEVTDMNFDLLRNLKKKHEDVRKKRIPFDVQIDQANAKLRPAEERVRNLESRQLDLDSVRGKKLKALTQAQREDRYDDSR